MECFRLVKLTDSAMPKLNFYIYISSTAIKVCGKNNVKHKNLIDKTLYWKLNKEFSVKILKLTRKNEILNSCQLIVGNFFFIDLYIYFVRFFFLAYEWWTIDGNISSALFEECKVPIKTKFLNEK